MKSDIFTYMESLLKAVYGLCTPWEVTGIAFSAEKERLDITVHFPMASTFTCATCGDLAVKHTTPQEEEWPHALELLPVYDISSRLRSSRDLSNPKGCGIRKTKGPLVRPGSGFKLLFEAPIMSSVREMPVRAIANLIDKHDLRLQRIVR